MAGGAGNDDDGAITAINITPLVDIALVLLIIFMVTAKIIVSQAIPVDLPKGATGSDAAMTFTITITKDAVVLANKRPIANDEDLRKTAADALAKEKDLRTVIQASSQVSHGVVMHVLDQLRQAGVTKIGFAIDKTVTMSGVQPAPKP